MFNPIERFLSEGASGGGRASSAGSEENVNNALILAFGLMVTAASPAIATCGGDCNVDGRVTVDEIVLGVNIALGSSVVDACRAMDGNQDSQVTVDEIVTALNNALSGCPSLVGEYSGSVDLDDGQEGAVALSAAAGGEISGQLDILGSLRALLRTTALPSASVPVSGSYNEISGVFEVTGQFLDNQGGSHTVAISGTLPGSNAAVPFTLQVDDRTYVGSMSRSIAPVTPTATATATQASAPTPTPGLRPSPPPGCVNSKGYTRIVISEAVGTNAYRDLNQPLDMFDVGGAEIAAQRGITTNSLTCPVTLDAPIIGLTAGVNGFPEELAQGNVYPLSAAPVFMLPYILITVVDYSERLATDVFNARLWRATSGTYTVAALTDSTATVVIDAQMQPVPTSAATGTFRMEATVIVDMLVHN
jgi:hypothetical protein